MEKIQYLPKGISPPGFSIEGVRGRDSVNWQGDVLLGLENFHHGLLEVYPWLLSEGPGETEPWGLLKILLTAKVEKVFLESFRFCELSFAMLTMVRDNELSWCAAYMYRPSIADRSDKPYSIFICRRSTWT